MSEYGISLSFSMVENEDGVYAGVHYYDTKDLDVDVEVEGENREEVLYALCDEVIAESLAQTFGSASEEEPETPEMSIEALQEENAQLRDEINYLRECLDDAYEEVDSLESSLLKEDAWNLNDKIENKGNQYSYTVISTDDTLDDIIDKLTSFVGTFK